MSLLPNQILPETTPFGQVNEDGSITISHNWYLFLYNLAFYALPSGGNNDVLAIETFLPRVSVFANPDPASDQLRFDSFAPKQISAPINPASDLLKTYSFAPKQIQASAGNANDLIRTFSFMPDMNVPDLGNSQNILMNQIFGA